VTGNTLKKILIVDDEQTILFSLSYLLRNERVEVITCDVIEQAEEALATTNFDMVIADIRMSGVNGIEGLELLSFIKNKFGTDVIVMTGYGDEDTEADAYRRGAYHYFNKPIDIPVLLEKVAGKGIPIKYN